jgi:hypothetical protein
MRDSALGSPHKWSDQHGKSVTDITPEQSIEERVREVTTRTKDTPISYQQARVITVCHNELAPLLDKIVDKDGKIPTGKQVSDMREEFRVTYFNSLTGDNPPEPVSSEDEATKSERWDACNVLTRARVSRLDKFHPMDLYLYFHFGPATVGGCGSPYFLESAEAIQQAVKTGECSNRDDLSKRNDKELVEKAQVKKGKRLLTSTVDEMEECGPTSSFGEAYDKQLELEEVRVETERSREQRENTQCLIRMMEGQIAKATTPQEKSAYETDMVELMQQAVAHAKLKVLVSSSISSSSISSLSAQSSPSTSSGIGIYSIEEQYNIL